MTRPAVTTGVSTSPQHALDAGHEAVEGDEVKAKAEQTRGASSIDEKLNNQNGDAPVKQAGKLDSQPISAPEKHAGSSSDARTHWSAVQVALGDFLETVEAQVGLILLIAVDVCASVAQIYVQTRQELVAARQVRGGGLHDRSVGSAYTELLAGLAGRALGAVSAVALGVYVLELLVLLAVFKRQFVAHAGYAFDAALVVATVVIEAWTGARAVRLLGVLRVWRVFRVVSAVVERERVAHDASKTLLELERTSTAQLRMEKLAAEESLKREYASRSGLERLLYDYKDEVATLKEALEIAAQAVAEAEMLSAQHSELATDVSADAQYHLHEQPLYDGAYGQPQGYQTADVSSQPQPLHVTGLSMGIDPEKLPDDPESDFEDAIQSDSEPLG